MADAITQILLAAWLILCTSAPYVLFGLLMAGLLKGLIPDSFVTPASGRQLGQGRYKGLASGHAPAAVLLRRAAGCGLAQKTGRRPGTDNRISDIDPGNRR